MLQVAIHTRAMVIRTAEYYGTRLVITKNQIEKTRSGQPTFDYAEHNGKLIVSGRQHLCAFRDPPARIPSPAETKKTAIETRANESPLFGKFMNKNEIEKEEKWVNGVFRFIIVCASERRAASISAFLETSSVLFALGCKLSVRFWITQQNSISRSLHADDCAVRDRWESLTFRAR